MNFCYIFVKYFFSAAYWRLLENFYFYTLILLTFSFFFDIWSRCPFPADNNPLRECPIRPKLDIQWVDIFSKLTKKVYELAGWDIWYSQGSIIWQDEDGPHYFIIPFDILYLNGFFATLSKHLTENVNLSLKKMYIHISRLPVFSWFSSKIFSRIFTFCCLLKIFRNCWKCFFFISQEF